MKYDNSVKDLTEIISSMIMQLQEIEIDIEARLSADDFDISRLPNIEERISLLEQLKENMVVLLNLFLKMKSKLDMN